jgi:hypothetical protein
MRIMMIMGNTPKVGTQWSRPLPSESAGRPVVAEYLYEWRTVPAEPVQDQG